MLNSKSKFETKEDWNEPNGKEESADWEKSEPYVFDWERPEMKKRKYICEYCTKKLKDEDFYCARCGQITEHARDMCNMDNVKIEFLHHFEYKSIEFRSMLKWGFLLAKMNFDIEKAEDTDENILYDKTGIYGYKPFISKLMEEGIIWNYSYKETFLKGAEVGKCYMNLEKIFNIWGSKKAVIKEA